ncbi:D123-domain-containing protein [Durotheca rogersii]|uniref:D123-domain-containing protein n=1 Tax=Durotheca rogersii TaxID=419775 RepID=UPI00221E5CEB|nr:D123-domain-containing protein [Durotheca rogersii]KAI5863228.1 D123-domain-containing protein [Durotheca rogersii]
MPAFTSNTRSSSAAESSSLQFPPITRDHILNCSYDSWFPKYRTSCIKSRIIPLSPEFVEYLREDGIVLADDDGAEPEDDEWESAPSTFRPPVEEADSESDSDEEEEAPRLPPNQRFPELHQTIQDKIAELGGAVAPKLNWTAPKDAAWISPHQNTIKCTCPNDIYLLLKSSNFITYDLEHAFDDCTIPVAVTTTATTTINNGNNGSRNSTSSGRDGNGNSNASSMPSFKPVLVLRSYFNPHTAMEFRCFVKHRNLIAISQRDLHYYEFLASLRPAIVGRIAQLFNHKLRYTFPDGSFVFDVYLPESNEGEEGPLSRARLIDINSWAPHTDSLLFDWAELLATEVPGPVLGVVGSEAGSSSDEEDEDEDEDFVPELRLVEREDPAALNFSVPQYSAHKLPKDVVDASAAGEGGMRDFARKWREMLDYRRDVASWELDGKEEAKK